MTRFSAASLLAMSIATLSIAMPVHAEVRAQEVAVRISAARLDRALAQFIEQTRQQILYSPDIVRGRQGRAVSGTYSPDRALSMILEGSGLRSRRTPGGAYVLEAAAPPCRKAALPPLLPPTHPPPAKPRHPKISWSSARLVRARGGRMRPLP